MWVRLAGSVYIIYSLTPLAIIGLTLYDRNWIAANPFTAPRFRPYRFVVPITFGKLPARAMLTHIVCHHSEEQCASRVIHIVSLTHLRNQYYLGEHLVSHIHNVTFNKCRYKLFQIKLIKKPNPNLVCSCVNL